MSTVPAATLAKVVDRLALAVFIFHRNRLAYCNAAAESLRQRLRTSYRIEIDVILRDHLGGVLEHKHEQTGEDRPSLVSLLTAPNGEPFYIHVMPLSRQSVDVGVSVRVIGSEIDACRRRYGLSQREAQVAELVLHGYRNTDIASALGIATTTTKKHLTRIFDKVGVDTRSQLQTRLA
jgi:ATP/maltotriose-dependent transcriptional regulator MalT